jgi:hypothetical protein
MTVKQLREILKHSSDDAEVVLSSDAEGNSYSPLHSCERGDYTPDPLRGGRRKPVKEALILYPE